MNTLITFLRIHRAIHIDVHVWAMIIITEHSSVEAALLMDIKGQCDIVACLRSKSQGRAGVNLNAIYPM